METAVPASHLERAEATRAELWPGVFRRTLVWGTRVLLCEVELPAGAHVQPHAHLQEQIGYVARGNLRFTVAGKSFDVGAGGGYFVPSGERHEVLALADSIAVDVFSPVRDEYKD